MEQHREAIQRRPSATVNGNIEFWPTLSVQDQFPSVLWLCWLGDRKGIRPVKKLDVCLLVVMIWLELCTTY